MNQFEIIHDDNFEKMFEALCSDIYKTMLDLSIVKKYFNHSIVEAEPAMVDNSKIGFQVKSNRKITKKLQDDLIMKLDKSEKIEGNIKFDTILYFFAAHKFHSNNISENKYIRAIREHAEKLGIKADFFGRLDIEELLEQREFRAIRNKYIDIKKELVRQSTYQSVVNEKLLAYYIDRNVFYEDQIANPIELFEDNNVIYIVGEAGTGKSVYTQHLLKKLNSLGYSTSHSELAYYDGSDINGHFSHDAILDTENKAIIFDGLDEINELYLKKFEILCKQLIANKCKIVISVRNVFYRYMDFTNQDGAKLYIRSFSFEEIEDYLNKRIFSRIDDFLLKVEAEGCLMFLYNPFYLSLMVEDYESSNQIKQIDDLIELVIEKDIRDTNCVEIEQELYSYICNKSIEMINTSKYIFNMISIPKKLRNYFSKSRLFTIDKNIDKVKFIHNIFNEYYVSKMLLDMNDEKLLSRITVCIQNRNYVYPKYNNVIHMMIKVFKDERFIKLLMKVGNFDNYITEELVQEIGNDEKFNIFRSSIIDNLEKKYFIHEIMTLNKYSFLIDNEYGISECYKLMDKFYHRTSLYIVTSVLEEIESKKLETYKDKVLDYISQEKKSAELSILLRHASKFTFAKSESEMIVYKYLQNANSELKSAIYYFIHKQGHQDYFCNEIISKQFSKINQYEKANLVHEDNIFHMGEDMNKRECIENFSDESSIIKLGEKIINEMERFDYSQMFIDKYSSYLSGVDELSLELRSNLINIFISSMKNSYNGKIEELVPLLYKHKLLSKLICIIKLSSQPDYLKISLLAIISKKDSYKIIFGFILSDNTLKEYLNAFIDKTYDLYKEGNATAIADFFIYEEYRTSNTNLTAQDYFNLFFEPNYILNSIDKIIDFCGDDFNWQKIARSDDLKNIDWSIKRFVNDNPNLEISELSKDIDYLTMDFVLGKIYQDNNIQVNDTQLKEIESMIEKNKEKILLLNALTKQEATSISYYPIYMYIAYLVYEFDVKVCKGLYEKMLSFNIEKSTDHQRNLKLLEKYLGELYMINHIVEAINGDTIVYETLLMSRINYLSSKNVALVLEYTKVKFMTLMKDSHLKPTLIEYIIKFEGVEFIINNINKLTTYELLNMFKNVLFTEKELVRLKSKISDVESEEDMNLINHKLLETNKQDDIDRYIAHCEDNGTIFDVRNIGDSYSSITDIRNLLRILELVLKYSNDTFSAYKGNILETIKKNIVDSINIDEFESKISLFRQSIESSKVENAHYYLYNINRYIHEFISK